MREWPAVGGHEISQRIVTNGQEATHSRFHQVIAGVASAFFIPERKAQVGTTVIFESRKERGIFQDEYFGEEQSFATTPDSPKEHHDDPDVLTPAGGRCGSRAVDVKSSFFCLPILMWRATHQHGTATQLEFGPAFRGSALAGQVAAFQVLNNENVLHGHLSEGAG